MRANIASTVLSVTINLAALRVRARAPSLFSGHACIAALLTIKDPYFARRLKPVGQPSFYAHVTSSSKRLKAIQHW